MTKNVGRGFTVKFLDPTEAKIVKKAKKEHGKKAMEELDILCKMSKRIARAKLKQMKHQMMKHRVRGFLARLFLSLNFHKAWTHQRDQIRLLARNCLEQTKPMGVKSKSVTL